MDILTWILAGSVVVCSGALIVKSAAPLLRYRKAKDRVVQLPGEIHSFFGLEKMKHSGQEITSFYPVYACQAGDEVKMLNGVVRHTGNPVAFVGMKSTMLYDKETGEIWCEEDLPLMAKQIKTRLLTVALLLSVLIAVSVMH